MHIFQINLNFSNPVSIVPCLANLQIWGKLSQSVNEVKRKEIDSIWLALNKAKQNPIQINKSEIQAGPSSVSSKRVLEDHSVPEEFLGMVSNKMSVLTFFDQVCFKQNFVTKFDTFYPKKIPWPSVWFIFCNKLLILKPSCFKNY